MSVAQVVVVSLERMLENVYELAGKWIGVDASEVSIRIGEQFAMNDPNPTDSLLKLNLSDEDLKSELVRRGIITDQVEISAPQQNPQQPQVPQEPNINELRDDEM
jgi:hypothetical protein